MITDIGHPAFATHDLERSLAFYRLLGIHETFRLNRPDTGKLLLVYLHVAGDRFIELFPGGPEPVEDRPGSFMHLCLVTDNLHGLVEELRQAGVTIFREPSLGLDHNWQAWVHDPDGNAIEFMQLTEESPQRQQARAWAAAQAGA
jgi:catechol 2,3-dioxygenase-like lactoylglutathione lyase family enzyme